MELPKKFKNRENELVSISTNRPKVYLSRSTALVGLVFAMTKDNTFVLVTKRSGLMPDSPHKLSLPCGYLDWDETRYDGMMREVYEETSFYMPDFEEYLIYSNDKQPFYTKDDPKELHQNISHIYISVYDFRDATDLFMKEVEEFSCKETEWVKWFPIEIFLASHYDFSWAFNHDETIYKGLGYWNNLPYNKE